jgi:hypothetical protein
MEGGVFKRAIRIPVGILVITAMPTQALAQYCADGTASPCMQAKQQYSTNQYQISTYAPAECDYEIITAAVAWTNAGSYFALEDYSYFGYKYVTPGAEPGFQIVFNTSAEMGTYGSANAVTFYGDSVGSWPRPDGVVIPIVNDGDIVVNRDKWADGTIECSELVYTNKYDLTRTMAHEFGHTVGLNHNTNRACATYMYGQMVAFGSLCTPEVDAAKAMYGAKP